MRSLVLSMLLLAASTLPVPGARAETPDERAFAQAYAQALEALVERRRDDARAALQRAEAIGTRLPGEGTGSRRASPRLKALRYLVAAGYAEYGQRLQASQLLSMNLAESMGPGMHVALARGEGGQALVSRMGSVFAAAQEGDLGKVRSLSHDLGGQSLPGVDLGQFIAQAEMLALVQSGRSPVEHARFAEVAGQLLPGPGSGHAPGPAIAAGAGEPAPGSAVQRLQARLGDFVRDYSQPLSEAYLARSAADIEARRPVRVPPARLREAERELLAILELVEGLPEKEAEHWRREILLPIGMYSQMSGARFSHPVLRNASDCMAKMGDRFDQGVAARAEWIQQCAPMMSTIAAVEVSQTDARDLYAMSMEQLRSLAAEVHRRDAADATLALQVQQRMVELMILRGELEAADALALQMRAATLSGTPEDQARALMAHARVLLSLGDPAAALARTREARALVKARLLAEDPRHADLLALQARARAMLGDDAAIADYRALAAGGREVLAAAAFFQHKGLRGELANMAGRFQDQLRLALDVPAEGLVPESLDTAIVALELLLGNGQATSSSDWRRIRDALGQRFPSEQRLAALDVQLARLLAREGKPADAAREARRAIERLASLDAPHRGAHPDDPYWWLAPTGHVLEHAAPLLRQGALTRGPNAEALFLAVQLAGRDVSGQAVRRMRARLAAASETDASIRRYEALLADRAELSSRLTDAPPELAAGLLAQLAAVQAEQDTLSRSLSRSAPEYWRLVRQSPVTPRQVAGALGRDQVFIHFGWLGDELWVLRTGRDGVQARAVAITPAEMAERIAGLRKTLEPDASGRFPGFDAVAARGLHDLLLGPELSDTAQGTLLVLVPSGPLHALPFAALVREGRDGYLVRHFPLVMSASPGAWLALRELEKRPLPGRGFLGVGNPRLGDQAPAAEEFVVSNALTLRNAARRLPAIKALPPLPDTETEIRRLEVLFGRARNTLLLGEKATEPELRSLPLRDYDILGFSTHGLLSGDVEGIDEAGLVLTPPDIPRAASNDGFLAASEVATLSLDANWVLLAACNTGRVAEGGVPTIGPLAQAFHYAGARSLLVTHWPVASGATLELVGSLVGHHEELGKARALQRAMLGIADDPGHGHPGYWAAFFLLGS